MTHIDSAGMSSKCDNRDASNWHVDTPAEYVTVTMWRRARCGTDAGNWSTAQVLIEIDSRATVDRTTVHTMSSRNDAGCVSRETGPAFPRLQSSANPLCAADGENYSRTNAAFCNCTPSRSTHCDQHIGQCRTLIARFT